MHPVIKKIPETRLIGKRLRMSLSENKTAELWRSFMPRRKEVQYLSAGLFSLQVYDNLSYFSDFNPHTTFEILGEKYKNDDSESEEEIFIPIKARDIMPAISVLG